MFLQVRYIIKTNSPARFAIMFAGGLTCAVELLNKVESMRKRSISVKLKNGGADNGPLPRAVSSW
jgi:hypothetical protein